MSKKRIICLKNKQPLMNFLVDLPEEQIKEINCDNLDENWEIFNKGKIVWSLQTYVILKSHGCNVKASRNLDISAINFVHIDDLIKMGPKRNHYIISMRADRSGISWTNFEIIQNIRQKAKNRHIYITHWPQPGLIPRNNKNGVRNVVFSGHPSENCLSKYPIIEDLSKINLRYKVMSSNNWNDFSDVDILLAIRRFGKKTFTNKPSTKLINSWHANIPLIAGNDSAFQDVGEPNENYIKVDNYKQMLTKIKELSDNPALYEKILYNSQIKRKEYTREVIAEEWIKVIKTIIIPDFEKVSCKNESYFRSTIKNVIHIKSLISYYLPLLLERYTSYKR